MIFIVTLIALVIERFFDWSHLRNWSWYTKFQRILLSKMSGFSPYLVLAASILPWLIIVGVIESMLTDVLYGFVKLLLNIVILIYCLGPQNLWANAFACINASAQGDAQFASEKLKSSFGGSSNNNVQSLQRHFLSDIFVESNRRVFAVVFWFAIIGPIGALLYRMVSLSAIGAAKQETIPELNQDAIIIENVLDWLPVRMLTFLFALGGHFAKVITSWRHQVMLGLNGNESLLTDCGDAAVGADDKEKLEEGAVGRDAVALLDRSFVIFLVIVAIVMFLT